MRREAIKIADNGYTILIKVSDFLLINLVLTFIISLRGESETAIGLAASVLFSVIFLLVSEYSDLYKKYVRDNYYRTTLKTFIALLLSSFVWVLLCDQFDALKGGDNSHLNYDTILLWLVLSFVVLVIFKVGVIYAIREFLRNSKKFEELLS